MKRFWKIVLLIAGIVAGIGFFCVILGAMMGGGPQAADLLWHSAEARWEAGEEVVRTLAEDEAFWETADWDEGMEWDDETGWREMAAISEAYHENLQVADAAQVQELTVKAGRCELVITKTDQDTYAITSDNLHELQYFLEDGELVILADSDWKRAGWENRRLTVYIPETGSVSDLNVELGAGACVAENLKVDNLKVESGAGSFIVQGLQARNAEIIMGAGQAEITDAEVTDLVIEAGMGDFFWEGSIQGNLKAECAMGAIHLLVAGAKEDFNYRTECVAGSIQAGDMEENLTGERYVDNGAGKEMKLECAMGRIEVGFYEKGGNDYE
ncbi:MAG: DUF4097 domain-containing protein [Lachnospiraceae bacterium]|nr:DUF4097 domain-containing protein [Lachnospiraceae bacterium]